MSSGALRYLSLLGFDDGWLAELARRAPGVQVGQLPAQTAADVPAGVWAGVDVLHTSAVLPEPEQAPQLRWVQLDTSGVDHLQDAPLWRTGVDVTTLGGISPVPMAEYTMFALLGMAHRLPALLRLRQTREWPSAQSRWREFMPKPVAGATVGIVGYGRIGREIGRLATAHGMTVVGVTRSGLPASAERMTGHMSFGPATAEPEVELRPVTQLRAVAQRCDYLVVVCPRTPETLGLIDVHVLGALPPGAVLVNVSRGGVVDEPAVRAALHSGALSGAALDVFATEPLPSDDPWWDEPDVLVSPHSSGLAPRYADQVLDLVAENLRRLQDGLPLLNLVDRARAY